MPRSEGKSLPYTSKEACIVAAKKQGVSSAPCMNLPTGTTNPGGAKPKKLPTGGGGGMGY
jgi:hypothetical protein